MLRLRAGNEQFKLQTRRQQQDCMLQCRSYLAEPATSKMSGLPSEQPAEQAIFQINASGTDNRLATANVHPDGAFFDGDFHSVVRCFCPAIAKALRSDLGI